MTVSMKYTISTIRECANGDLFSFDANGLSAWAIALNSKTDGENPRRVLLVIKRGNINSFATIEYAPNERVQNFGKNWKIEIGNEIEFNALNSQTDGNVLILDQKGKYLPAEIPRDISQGRPNLYVNIDDMSLSHINEIFSCCVARAWRVLVPSADDIDSTKWDVVIEYPQPKG